MIILLGRVNADMAIDDMGLSLHLEATHDPRIEAAEIPRYREDAC
jgi:hypothetical protein